MKVSDYLAEYLLDHGVDTCFCVTGGGAMHVNDSIGHNPRFKNIYVHHEQAAAMAAEGYARITNRPAVVSVTSGPGSTNAITGVFGSWTDSIPMIVISGQMKSETLVTSTPLELRYLGFQEANVLEMIESITKYSASINDLAYLKFHLDNAMCEATTGRPGPVWLDIPIDIQAASVNEEDFVGNLSFETRKARSIPFQTDKHVKSVIKMIEASSKPVIMLGEEIRWSSSVEAVLHLIEKMQIPVVTEWNAHDLLPDVHPLNCGRPGTIGNRGGNFVVQNADLLLCIGCQLSIRQMSYEWKNFANNAKIIAVNIDPNELDKPTIRLELAVLADCLNFVEELKLAANELSCSFDNWLTWCLEINNRYPVVLDDHFRNDAPLNVYALIDRLTKKAPEDCIFVLANGAACVVGLQASSVKDRTRIFTNSGASSMGYGIAASVGVCTATANHKTVVCVEGDGSIMMNLHELQTISTNKLNTKVLLLNNDGYHSIKQTQKNIFKAEEKGFCGANRDSGLGFPNFKKLAAAFDFKYISVNDIENLDKAIDFFYECDDPILFEAFVDPDQDFEPKLISKMNEDGTFSTPSLEDMHPFLSREEMKSNNYNPRQK